jgi:hypothetical protein
MRNLALLTGLATCIALTPISQALGACLASDPQGAWYVYAVGDNAVGDGFWVRCSIRFNASGRVQFGSSCFDELSDTATVVGQLNVRPGCRTLGTLTFNAEAITLRCDIDASLAATKQAGAGVGRCETGELFLLNLVKG